MDDVEEMLREMSEKYKNSKSVEVYEEQLEGWFKLIDDLREENGKLRELIMATIKMAFERNGYDAMTHLIDEGEKLGFIYVRKSCQ